MGELYPPIEPYRQEYLQVSSTHTLYIEESGNPKGLPVLFVHGGPGGGTSPVCRRFFDPNRWRIILFDQRGCGLSHPTGSLEDNTTWHLIEDMEAIRRHLGIGRWVLFGGSWGSTLSLSYAIKHPTCCLGLILRGIFLLRPQELAWFYEGGASAIFPDYWEDFVALIPEDERGHMIAAYYKQLTHEDEETRLKAAQAWAQWEVRTSRLYIPPETMGRFQYAPIALAFSRIECHYFINGGFFDSTNWILEHIDPIRHIPTSIVQGRYDMVCPPVSAWDLHRAWPEAIFRIMPYSGHSMTEIEIQSYLLDQTDMFAKRFRHHIG